MQRKEIVKLIEDAQYNLAPILLLESNGWKITLDVSSKVYTCLSNEQSLFAHWNLKSVVDYLYNNAPAVVINNKN